MAHVVLREGSELTADSLRAHMKAALAPHKCPRVFVFDRSLPRTATGKLQRFLLRTSRSRCTDQDRLDPAHGPAGVRRHG